MRLDPLCLAVLFGVLGLGRAAPADEIDRSARRADEERPFVSKSKLHEIDPPPIAEESATDDPLPAMADEELEDRSNYLERAIARNARLTKLWHSAVTGVYGCGLLVQSARAAEATDPADRADLTTSAVKALIGVVARLAHPPRSVRGPTPVDLFPGSSHAARARRLLAAEAMLRLDAKDSDRRYWWLSHGLNAALNVAGALIVGLGYHDWALGLQSAGIGIAVGELTIWTQPWQAKSAWGKYKRQYGLAPRAKPYPAVQSIYLRPSIGGTGASGVLGLTF